MPLRSPSTMVIAARLHWLQKQVEAGHAVSVHLTYNAATRKDKIRFLVSPHAKCGPPDSHASLIIPSAIQLVISASFSSNVVDRGHRFSDGSSEACFWLRRRGVFEKSLPLTQLPRCEEHFSEDDPGTPEFSLHAASEFGVHWWK